MELKVLCLDISPDLHEVAASSTSEQLIKLTRICPGDVFHPYKYIIKAATHCQNGFRHKVELSSKHTPPLIFEAQGHDIIKKTMTSRACHCRYIYSFHSITLRMACCIKSRQLTRFHHALLLRMGRADEIYSATNHTQLLRRCVKLGAAY